MRCLRPLRERGIAGRVRRRTIGGADGLSHTSYLHLRETLGAPYADRLVSAERFVSDFRATRTALDATWAALEAADFNRIDFNQPSDDPDITDVVLGPHSVGNWGHGVGPSLAEWGGAKVRIPLEDDAVVTERGVEWLYPVTRRVLLIR